MLQLPDLTPVTQLVTAATSDTVIKTVNFMAGWPPLLAWWLPRRQWWLPHWQWWGG